ncbi:hypothetical protein KUTeg_024296 [Tegillarca granosa]|uniref:Large ribosomal subunit protein uL22m n=1 Tax=Tegillarca granosa TaxID=220873 RepID=A0ABQ9E2L2_TEGGR|nr:hypothetical protein KUTeg_024296 [Tegillarca granosa]
MQERQGHVNNFRMQNPVKLCTSLLKSGALGRSLFNKTILPATVISKRGINKRKDEPVVTQHGLFSLPTKWMKYNDIVYPPQKEGEPRRPAEICYVKLHQKYSPDKLWYTAKMIRGMSIDEALKQLSFDKHKGAKIIKEALLEAQEMAVRDFNVEFKSNLWIESSNTGKGKVVKGITKKNPGIIHYRYSHYFVRLREGTPPKDYYPRRPTGYEKMEDYIKEQRSRRIKFDL